MDNNFWLNDPTILFKNLEFIPNCEMNNSQRLNALTRLLIIIVISMWILDSEYTIIALGTGMILIFMLRSNPPTEHFKPEISEKQALNSGIRGYDPYWDSRPHGPRNKACYFNADTGLLNALYEVTPPIQFNHYDDSKRSYSNAKYELTPLTDTDGFKQIWRNDSSMCGGYSMIPNPLTEFPVEEPYPQGQCNYIFRTKIDHAVENDGTHGGFQSLRAVAEQDWINSQTEFRNGIMNEHIDRFRRERQHNCADMPLNSFSAGSGSS